MSDIDYENYDLDVTPYLSESAAAFIRRPSFAKLLTRIKLYEMAMHTRGHIVECGVYQGASLIPLIHLAETLEPHNLERKVIGFDTFEGFKSVSSHDKAIDREIKEGMLHGNYDDLRFLLELNRREFGRASHQKGHLIKGDACETIRHFVEDNPTTMISLLILDFDLYEPTKVALELLYPRVVKGGIVAIDDLGNPAYQGVEKAVDEHFVMNALPIRRFPFESWISYWQV